MENGEIPFLFSLRSWAKSFWNLRGELHLTFLGGPLILFEKINLDESELIPMGEVYNTEDLARVLGYKVGSLPSTYLGLPLGASFNKCGT